MDTQGGNSALQKLCRVSETPFFSTEPVKRLYVWHAGRTNAIVARGANLVLDESANE
jgi:hypothetical protein